MISQLKSQLRKHYLNILKNIPISRSDHAAQQAISSLINKYIPPNQSFVLSFYSMTDRHEIDLSQFNQDLAKQQRLVLPRVNSNQMDCYYVPDLSDHYLIKSKFGIYEPNPDYCRLIYPNQISTIIVPGLAFEDHSSNGQYYRLGRGGGYYDRYLPLLEPTTIKLGVAYIEQAYSEKLPINNYDQPVDRVIFF